MRLFWVICTLGVAAASAQNPGADAWQLELKGEGGQAREQLQKAAQASPRNAATLRAYAEFLAEHRDPAAREVYTRLERVLASSNAPKEQIAACARREAILDLVAGDRAAAARHVELYRSANGSGLALPNPAPAAAAAGDTIEIPGPLRSFARMAALSPDLQPEDLLAAAGAQRRHQRLSGRGMPTKRWNRPNT